MERPKREDAMQSAIAWRSINGGNLPSFDLGSNELDGDQPLRLGASFENMTSSEKFEPKSLGRRVACLTGDPTFKVLSYHRVRDRR